MKHYFTLTEKEKIVSLLGNLSNEELAIDIETNGLSPFYTKDAKILTIALSWEVDFAICIPLFHKQSVNDKDILIVIKEILETNKIIGHNLKFEYTWLKYLYDINIVPYFDTMLAHYCINSRKGTHSLNALTETYFSTDAGYWNMLEKEKTKLKPAKRANYENIPFDVLTQYNCQDVDITWQLYNKFKDINSFVFKELLMPSIIPTAEMEITGVACDKKEKERLLKENKDALQDIYNQLIMYPEVIELQKISKLGIVNFNSSQQIAELLFNKLKLPVISTTPKDAPSTDVDVLTKLKDQHEIPNLLLEYRKVQKRISTYLESVDDWIGLDGRIHTDENAIGTETLRTASSNPDLQNIPTRGEGKELRKLFVASAGNILIKADYDQLELKIMAIASGDENLTKAFVTGEDVHAYTAAFIFGVDISKVTSAMRRAGKTANFGIIYGISEYGLAKFFRKEYNKNDINNVLNSLKAKGQLKHFDQDPYICVAKNVLDAYFKLYPGINQYAEKQKAFAREHGYIENFWGWKRYIDNINNEDRYKKEAAERQAMNTPIQSAAAVFAPHFSKRYLYDWFKQNNSGAKVVLTVHDEILIDCPEKEKDWCIESVKLIMENITVPWNSPIKLTVSIKTGKNWMEMA